MKIQIKLTRDDLIALARKACQYNCGISPAEFQAGNFIVSSGISDGPQIWIEYTYTIEITGEEISS